MTRKQVIDKIVQAQVENWNNAPEKLKDIVKFGVVGITDLSNSELEDMYESLTDKEIAITQ